MNVQPLAQRPMPAADDAAGLPQEFIPGPLHRRPIDPRIRMLPCLPLRFFSLWARIVIEPGSNLHRAYKAVTDVPSVRRALRVLAKNAGQHHALRRRLE